MTELSVKQDVDIVNSYFAAYQSGYVCSFSPSSSIIYYPY